MNTTLTVLVALSVGVVARESLDHLGGGRHQHRPGGGAVVAADGYRFLPTLGEFDLHLIAAWGLSIAWTAATR